MTKRSRSTSRRKTVKRPSKTLTIVNIVLLVVFTLLSAIALFLMFKYQFLAFRHLNIALTAVLGVIFVVSLLLIILKKWQLGTSVILVLSSLVSSMLLFGFNSAIGVANKMNETASYSEVEMSIVVPKDSSISDVSQLTSVQAPTNNDASNINALIEQISKDKGVTLTTETVDSYRAAYENLIAGSSQAMVMNSAYSGLLELSYSDYADNVKSIYTYTVKVAKESDDNTSTDANVFNIYISGIDTYGSISTVSRSDVNIILTVNMNTHKILMTTTPRDSYVQIPDGGANQYDKLTHAGIYGVQTSEKTLENLYGIPIDYYARINFTSFLNLIDAVGGVTVYNDQAFTSLHGNYQFEVGNVTLNSDKALGFVRERYSLQNGDYDRGENQLKVIQAIINKLTSLSSISSYSTIITSLENSVQTDMSLDKMMELANAQLDSGKSFTITSQEVTGTGSTGTLVSYAMPTASLYMIQLDQTSVATASQAIKDVMAGK
ncbi:LCP family glycopolymer transferase CpsA [Streptococcus loxodontisalivarius]|uniref:LCP family protein required for cell wall assembly n=1 Tax=Streptococcus loxodontisalivarius TaxID=1349415 RepID=A0ABS2PP67_9STRE|nr:LCP family protein [Streptococcus loxodontisalivarius]MBM7641765.1 LCP family protein required for cell wall assembly [Streptococcus loxodontisalivarius]